MSKEREHMFWRKVVTKVSYTGILKTNKREVYLFIIIE